MRRSPIRRSLRFAPTAAALALSVTGLLATGGAVGAQQQQATLPDEVSAWMARDQVRRWANLIETGEQLFKDGSCTFCHGEGGAGGRSGPNLTDSEWVQGDGSLQSIREIIFWGVRRRDFADPSRPFQMNPKGGMDLDGDQLDALTAYVWSRSNGTFLPGR